MRRTRTVLTSTFFALVLVADTSTQGAADECLTQPTGPTPQGQHWYYRLDHANGGRQCWYLRVENGRGQKASTKAEANPADAMAQTIDAPRGTAAAARAEPSPEKKAPATVAPVPWLNIQKLPGPGSFIPAAAPAKPDPVPRGADATESSAETTTIEKNIDPAPAAVPSRSAASADGGATPTYRTREQQRRQQAQARPEPPAPAPAIIHADHTFALLMIMLVALAIAGPALHFVERRRRRAAINFRPPPWARVVALNAPTLRNRVPTASRTERVKPPAPMPIGASDQTERVAHALQQLVDRLQAVDRPEPTAMRMRTNPRLARRASM